MPPPLIGGALSDDAVWRLTSVAYIRSAGGVCGRSAGWRVLADRARLGRPGSRLPLRASVAGLGGAYRGGRPPAYSLFILGLSAAAHTQVGLGRNVGRWMVVARSNGTWTGVESQSRRCCNHCIAHIGQFCFFLPRDAVIGKFKSLFDLSNDWIPGGDLSRFDLRLWRITMRWKTAKTVEALMFCAEHIFCLVNSSLTTQNTHTADTPISRCIYGHLQSAIYATTPKQHRRDADLPDDEWRIASAIDARPSRLRCNSLRLLTKRWPGWVGLGGW